MFNVVSSALSLDCRYTAPILCKKSSERERKRERNGEEKLEEIERERKTGKFIERERERAVQNQEVKAEGKAHKSCAL